MRLQGTVDAAVNGGIAKYQDAFFGPDYLVVYPENADHVNRLKVLLSDQVSHYFFILMEVLHLGLSFD